MESGRDIILKRLTEDLIGPFSSEEKVQKTNPVELYLSGILWPRNSEILPDEDENLDFSGFESGDTLESSGSGIEEEIPVTSTQNPSSAGISFAVKSDAGNPVIDIIIQFSKYQNIKEELDNKSRLNEENSDIDEKWLRIPFDISIANFEIAGLSSAFFKLAPYGGPDDASVHVRTAKWADTRLITLTLVNDNLNLPEMGKIVRTERSFFHSEIIIKPVSGTHLVPRPTRSGRIRELTDEDDRIGTLLYRNVREFATGHTCSATWQLSDNCEYADFVATTWIPEIIVPAVSTEGHEVFRRNLTEGEIFRFSSKTLSNLTKNDLIHSLSFLPDAYSEWIKMQEKNIASLPPEFQEQANRNIDECKKALSRIEEGIHLIGSDEDSFTSFTLANAAMNLQYSWNSPDKDSQLIWRPFQLGFILLTLPSIINPEHCDRKTMDLLWFPTGGGKTEAYLCIVAFLAFYRRIKSEKENLNGSGVTALMRYTLRLLTTQQFERASAMILACELIRRNKIPGLKKRENLGQAPFSIGLWVGEGATPNNFDDAKASFTNPYAKSSPIQIIHCPCCHEKLLWDSDDAKKTITVNCSNRNCLLYNLDNTLPIWTIDSDIYQKKPTLLIGTIDKFARIVFNKDTNSLFGIPEKMPPELIIQDELHLISGPLGTIAGLYETAIDRMFTREGCPPKIIGSTATIRKADAQIKALFNRNTYQFPPSGLDWDDSGFSVIDHGKPGRKYAGVTTAGRTGKYILQAVAASVLQSCGEGLSEPDEKNWYGTMIGYFNSLRELGGALNMMYDDVNASIGLIAHKRDERSRKLRQIKELTSRASQKDIRKMLESLKIPASEKTSLDIVLASNMISVGIDVSRLGLMIVNGQPKSRSEYIQATSRVGRGNVPGLVITVLNNAKARDRSHYESFRTWHQTLYRDVEATSVTPYSSRARDRALHTVLVMLFRHLIPGMLERPDSSNLNSETAEELINYIIERAKIIDPEEKDVEKEIIRLIDKWEVKNPESYYNRNNPKKSLLQDAETTAKLKTLGIRAGDAWSTMNNMRNVEPSCPVTLGICKENRRQR